MIDYKRDFLLDFFGFRTFQRQYSMRIAQKCVERPQDMFMRTAIALSMAGMTNTSKEQMDKVLNNIRVTYNLLSNKLLLLRYLLSNFFTFIYNFLIFYICLKL